MVVGAAEEAESVGQDFQRAFAIHQAVQLHAFLEDLEDQILLLQAGDFRDVLLARFFEQLRHAHFLQFGDMDFALLDAFVPLMRILDIAFGRRGLRSGLFRGDLLGQRHFLRLAVAVLVRGRRRPFPGVGGFAASIAGVACFGHERKLLACLSSRWREWPSRWGGLG